MKLNKLFIHFAWVCFLSLAFASCKKGDTSYGTTNIYMPQASMTSDGAKGTFQVPALGGVKNNTIDSVNKKVIIPLSVFRSGMNTSEAIAVNLQINTDTLAKFMAKDPFNFSVIIPADKYSIPPSVTIKDGSNVEVFNLEVDLAYAKANEGKNLLVAVEVANPTNAKLNQGKTITLVNINTFLLFAGPIYGKFDPTALYYIRGHEDNVNVLGILGDSNDDGVVLQQQKKDLNNKYQQWQIMGMPNDTYRFINRGNQKSITVSENLNPNWGWPNPATSGRYVIQSTTSKTDTKQQWKLVDLGGGQNVLVNTGLPGDKFIDLWGYDFTPGATNVSLLDWHNYDRNDVFHFDKAD